MPEEAQQSAPQPQVTTGTQSHDWKKVSLTVLIILVVAGLIVAAYWFLVLNKSSDNPVLKVPGQMVTTPNATESAKEATPSAKKDETADWKKYSNSSLGYSLKHPPEVVIDSDDKNRIDFFYQKSSSSDFAYRWSFGVSVEDTIRKDLDEVKEAYIILQGKHENFQNVTVNSLDVLQFQFTREGSTTPSRLTAVIIKEGKEYTISLTLADETLDLGDFKQTFNSILSNFKFTE